MLKLYFTGKYTTGFCRTVVKLLKTDDVYARNYYDQTQLFHEEFTMFTGNLVKEEE